VCRFSLVIEKNTGGVTPEPSFALHHPNESERVNQKPTMKGSLVLLALSPMYAVLVLFALLRQRGRDSAMALCQHFHFPCAVPCSFTIQID
jgi:hypothetical protein